MTTAELFVKALENEGVKYVFGVGGEENLDLLEALRTSSIRFVATRHEQGAGFIAAAMGRLTGKAGVCLSTLGPGATNLVTAAAHAQLGGMPMVFITGQKPLRNNKQGRFQIVDASEVMAPVTKWTKRVISGSAIPAIVREAFRVAEEERPGAVHIELPEDVAGEEVVGTPMPVSRVRRPVAEERSIEAAALMIEEAKTPLLLIGAGANRKLTSKMLHAFVERTGIPFFDTQFGKGVIDERHPLCLGTAALSASDYVHCAIGKADLIINIGHDIVEKPPFLMGEGGPKVIHVNFTSALVDEIYFPELEVVGDIADTVRRLTERVRPQPHWNFTGVLKIKSWLDEQLAEGSDDARYPLAPQRVVADVRALVPDDGIVTADTGMGKLWFTRNYRAYGQHTVLVDNGLGSMGVSLPTAIAAKIVHPERKVVSVCGDGAFMMVVMELETAVRLKLDLAIVILNDGGYGMIKWKQDASGFSDFGLDFGNPDFSALAKSFGAKGVRVAHAGGVTEALEEAFRAGGVHVIDVPVDYSENRRVLTDELREKTCLL